MVSIIEDNQLWLETEARIARQLNIEDLRTSGILSCRQGRWNSALVRLAEAVTHGVCDIQSLDFLGEAAFRCKAPEILLPFRHLYSDPLIATHMARALFSIGEFAEAENFLKLAQDSQLKSAIQALLSVKNSIEETLHNFLPEKITTEQSIDKNEITLHLDYPTYWQALAAIADVAKRDDLVRVAEERSKALDYANPVVHFNQGIRFLTLGQLRAGWRLYEWCLHPESNCALSTKCAQMSMWQGESLAEKTLLVLVEFGFGEQIFNLRFIENACQVAKKIELAVSPEIFELAKASFPNLKIHLKDEVRNPAYWQTSERTMPQFWCYSFSIPSRLQIVHAVNSHGFLQAPEAAITSAQEKIRVINAKNLPVRGIVWHGEQTSSAMRTRAYSITEFIRESHILENPCVLVNLQKDATPEEIAELKTQTENANGVFFNVQSELTDFAKTAGWVKALDRLYSCDTSVAHLGGALGHPTTLLRRNKAIWQWIGTAPKSFWYDSVVVLDALVPEC